LKILLDDTATAWQKKARKFAEKELIPFEVDAEMNAGKLPPDVSARHKRMAIELGLTAMDVPESYGGLGLRSVDQVAVWEQLGRVTNALCWCFSEPLQWMFDACNEEQIQRYVLPLMTGARKECYAITEQESGSDVAVETTAEAVEGGYRINGEKWFVTSANHADYLLLQAKLTVGPHTGSDSLFFVDKDSPGIEEIRTPLFSHTFDHHHPEIRFQDTFVPTANRIGQEGDGMRFSHSWFRRERLMIAARDCGAAARLIEEAVAFAKTRTVSEEKLIDKQMVQSMLADSVTELWAAR
jgi:acyl-CoA dehydrogenase